MLSLPLCCMVFVVLVFCPKTDGGSLTWEQPPPNQTVQSATPLDHFSSRQLYEGTINATLSWHFRLNQLNFGSLVISLNGTPIAGVGSSGSGPQPGFQNKFGIEWNPNQKLVKLFIFKVTTEKNGTFRCQVDANEVTGFVTKNFQFRSNVQVHVVDPATSNIGASGDQNITAPAELTLNCSADGKPKPTITWSRLSDNTVVTMPLNITRGKNKESYRCTAYNGIGNPLTEDVIVNILFSPKITLAKKFFVGREQNASLICQVEGNPEPMISWSHCDGPNVFCDKQYLNISKVQTARSIYNCTARNALGIDSATTVVFIGGYNIYLRMGIIEECDKKYSVWEVLKKELTNVFAITQSYSGAELIVASCGSLIFDMVLKFRTEVAEDDTISIIQNAISNEKLGGLNVNTSYIIGIPPVPQTTTAPTSATPKSDDKTGLIIGVVLGSVALVALIVFTVWCVRKKKRNSERKEVSDNTDSAQGRKGKGPNGTDEVAYASTSMLPHSKRPVEETNQSTVQALPMYAQVDKTKKTSNKGGAVQRQRQPGELQYAEVEHVTSGRSLPKKSSSEPIKPSNEEIVYADLV